MPVMYYVAVLDSDIFMHTDRLNVPCEQRGNEVRCNTTQDSLTNKNSSEGDPEPEPSNLISLFWPVKPFRAEKSDLDLAVPRTN